MSGIAQQLESIVSASKISAWESLSAQSQQQLRAAVTPNTQVECVVYPETVAALAEVVAWAERDRVPFLLCGSLSKLHWGGLAQQVRFAISTARLNRLIEHAVGDLTVTAEAGMRLADLQAVLAQQGQFLPIDPAFPDAATLGGIVATADAGSLRQRYGGVRDLLIGVDLVRSDGQLAKAGGRVVKNVAGYDLMKLMTGSWGTLAAIAQVTLRIYPIADALRTVVLTGTADGIAQATQTLIRSSLTPIAADLLPPATVTALNLGEGFGLLARFGSIEISVREQVTSLMKVGAAIGLDAQAIEADEAALWRALREQVTAFGQDSAIACKIGVLPAEAVALLDNLRAIAPLGFIHASSGLGMLRFADLSSAQLGKVRSRCEASGGFLTVLSGSIALKQQFDLWGNVGNALPIMHKLKQQFDPHSLFSPGRFVGGI
ncbi:FAD-binding oxidoreductase [Microcoleus sp. FACHB-1515]|uniref:FAD-binding oxidoreductase n=1 Tax=Cyanophyceae TaxID=3028117 RepID=UPI001682061A|nr:FAD-binding oxidoreductase [Microcoleus sp. FACHB-1515]MBD2088717.1 FAD-binding oxidoreductase [Microcoleus sp. FACHB-1515]